MRKTWFKIFMGMFVLLFAGLWIADDIAEARSKGMKKRGHHRHHSPYRVEVPKVIAIVGGSSHSIELKSDGTVWAWGNNQYGQLGDGTTIDSSAPIQVSGLTDITAIVAGLYHTIALKTDGTVWAWGGNEYGQLGPVEVSGLTDVAAIAIGRGQTVVLKTDGTVWAWGSNFYGQLGDGTTDDSPTPVQVSGLTDVTAIAARGSHTIALKNDGTVWAWGLNRGGRLGAETTETCFSSMGSEGSSYPCSTTPVQVSGLTYVAAIAAGDRHTIALKNDGTVWAWGFNYYGQLGATTSETCSGYYGYYRPCSTTPVQVNEITDVTAIAAGFYHTIALKNDGTVWAWGDNSGGQLGDGTTDDSSTPVHVSDLTDVTAIAAGRSHTITLKNDGTVWTWGNNRYGQLGVTTTETCGYDYEGDINCSPTPVQVRSKVTETFSVGGTVSSLTGTLVLQNNGGDDLIITEDGLFTFATELEDLAIYDIEILTQPDSQACEVISINSGRINATDITDIQITCLDAFTEAVAIAAGSGAHTIALKTNGTVWAWGYNYYGQLGDGTTIDSSTSVQVSGLTDVTAIAAGRVHTLALKTDGTVWAWGSNKYGQLGAETIEICSYSVLCSTTPVEVIGLTDVTAIAAGGYRTIRSGDAHTIALKDDGTVWAWGGNYSGQLGDGTTTDSTTPVQVNGLTDVTAIAAGDRHTIALKTDGTVWAWGGNYSGQLGDGTATDSTTPVQVSGLTDVTAIAAGWSHTIALKTDGTVWAWGDNYYRQLGVETTETCVISNKDRYCSTTPVEVSGLTDVTAIAAGGNHTIALKYDGTVWTMPRQVIGLTDVVAVAVGGAHFIVIKIDGTVWAWGSNKYGQLGDWTTDDSTTPVQVLVAL